MNPHKMNKIDVSQMSEEDQKAFKMFGRLPQKNLLSKMQKDRKYFDSGDYMMSKAGVQSAQAPGTAIPTPEGLPHAFSPSAGSPPSIGHPSISPSSSSTSNSIPTLNTNTSTSGAGAVGSAEASPTNAQAQGQGLPSPAISHAQSSAQPIPGAASGASGHHPSGSFSGVQGQEKEGAGAGSGAGHMAFSPGVGVGIRPAGEEGSVGAHRRRLSVNMDGSRTSPPAPLREGSIPSSSYPIHHPGQSFGSSPVKTSLLARRMQVDENE